MKILINDNTLRIITKQKNNQHDHTDRSNNENGSPYGQLLRLNFEGFGETSRTDGYGIRTWTVGPVKRTWTTRRRGHCATITVVDITDR